MTINRFTSSALVKEIMDRNSIAPQDFTGSTKAATEIVTSRVFDGIKAILDRGESVRIAGFGTFKVTRREERTGRNPQTGEPMKIAARDVVTFKPSKAR